MINISVAAKCLHYIALGISLLLAGSVVADMNLSAGNLNASLKEIQRIHRKLESAPAATQPEIIFQYATKADDLAMQLTRHMIEYGNEQKGLIDLVLDRTAELDVVIRWHPDKQRYFYNGTGFQQYLDLAADGPWAADSAYQLLEKEFFQSEGKDIAALIAMSKHKQQYLERYQGSSRAAEVMIMLVIEYRDLSRIYQNNGNTANAINSIDMARAQARQVLESYPGTDKAGIAEELLVSIEDIANNLSR